MLAIYEKYRNSYHKTCELIAREQKERKHGSNTRAKLKVYEQVRKHEAPTGPLSSPSLPPSQGPDSCPVFIVKLCSSPAARPLAHTSHHNVSFFLVLGPTRVMGPLCDHRRGFVFFRTVTHRIDGNVSKFLTHFATMYVADNIYYTI